MVVGENGVLNRAQDASEKSKFASEKEAIEFIMSDIKTGLMIKEKIPESKYIGEKLSSMSAVTGDWKNVTVGENTYKDGWYLVEKGDEITGYGEAKLNWLINYDTGELIELKDGEYTIANANASGAIIEPTLKVNIDPANLQNPDEWGTCVTFVGGNPKDAVSKGELKFDGINDYLKIENVNIEKSSGLTFEFYGYSNRDGFSPLCKMNFKENGEVDTSRLTSFRCGIGSEEIVCCFGNGKSESDLSETNNHWMSTDKIKLNENIGYVSITIDTLTGNIKFFQDGAPVIQTTCSTDYLDSGDLFNSDIPFSVGLSVGGVPATVGYDNFDLYACRLYTRVLSDTEIQQNYIATTNYHNELIK